MTNLARILRVLVVAGGCAAFAPPAADAQEPGGGRTPTDADWARLAASWYRELDERIARLALLRERLTGCIGCGCLSVERCPLVNPNDAVAAKGPGAHYLEPPGGG